MILKLKRTNVDAHYDLASKRLRSMWRLDSAGSASSYMTCTVRLIAHYHNRIKTRLHTSNRRDTLASQLASNTIPPGDVIDKASIKVLIRMHAST
jgi:hypothetical protein